MRHTDMLSSSFNMSLGFIPVIITIVLCGYLPQETAIYIGTGIGLLGTLLLQIVNKTSVPNIIMYITTVIMTLLCMVTFLSDNYIPENALPITLETSILFPILLLFMYKNKAIVFYLKHVHPNRRRAHEQGTEATIVSARIVLFLGLLHLIVVGLFITIQGFPKEDTDSRLILFRILPLAVFILSILLNQSLIHYFNRLINHTEYLPIVTSKGEVIGKIPAVEATKYKNLYTHPVVRIAVSVQGMLLLTERPFTAILDGGKIDIPMESYLRYNESLTAGVERLMKSVFPSSPQLHPTFSITYQFKNEITNRLVYLFIIDINDESLVSPQKNGKLWSMQQIEDNMGKDFFSNCFEEEYVHLKNVIYTREKYKES